MREFEALRKVYIRAKTGKEPLSEKDRIATQMAQMKQMMTRAAKGRVRVETVN